ncbi:MAG: sulfoxide reductase heme-binding subunit YedZ [Anaerolineaceae bacterium]|nr:sulfoxide reductase heme-binding subunit YedZ [Anaerolineaceae bacterium]
MTQQTEGRSQESLRYQIKVLVYLIGFLPLVLLLGAYNRGELGFNPIETILHRTGQIAVVFLLLSLACTPINRLFKAPLIGRLRKPLGLFAAFYAGLHFLTFAVWDYGFDLTLIWEEIKKRPFILIGAFALLILIILAVTSLRFLQRKMGKSWVWLHRLVYLAGMLVVAHYLLLIKGDLLSLQGNYTAPLIAGGVLILLLVMRLPYIRRILGKKS